MSPQDVTVPAAEAVLIEYPGFVQDQEAALASLGGIDAVTAVVGSDSRQAELALRFRPGDALAHPVTGARSPTQGLLLRVTRQGARLQLAAGDEAISDKQCLVPCRQPGQQAVTEAVARVTSTFQFPAQADMQYVAADTGAGTAQVLTCPAGALSRCSTYSPLMYPHLLQAGEGPAGWSTEPLLAAPPYFLKASAGEFAYHPYYGDDPPRLKTGAAQLM